MSYKKYSQQRLKDNCRPISELEWETGKSLFELAEKYDVKITKQR